MFIIGRFRLMAVLFGHRLSFQNGFDHVPPKRDVSLFRWHQPQATHDLCGRLGLVHGVEV